MLQGALIPCITKPKLYHDPDRIFLLVVDVVTDSIMAKPIYPTKKKKKTIYRLGQKSSKNFGWVFGHCKSSENNLPLAEIKKGFNMSFYKASNS